MLSAMLISGFWIMANVELELDADGRAVLSVFGKNRAQAMPFLKLAALSELPTRRVAETVEKLSQRGLISLSGSGDISDQIVVASNAAFRTTAKLAGE